MSLSPEFISAVDSGNKLRTRIMLKDCMVLDPTFTTYDERAAYAISKMPDLYDDHDGEVLEHDMTAWTKDYMDSQMVTLIDNFSKERVELLRSVCRNIFSETAERIHVETVIRDAQKERKSVSKKQIGTGVAIGGGVAAAVGIACSQPVITVAGAVAVVVGGVMIFTDK